MRDATILTPIRIRDDVWDRMTQVEGGGDAEAEEGEEHGMLADFSTAARMCRSCPIRKNQKARLIKPQPIYNAIGELGELEESEAPERTTPPITATMMPMAKSKMPNSV